jgi:hypothetical protein
MIMKCVEGGYWKLGLKNIFSRWVQKLVNVFGWWSWHVLKEYVED